MEPVRRLRYYNNVKRSRRKNKHEDTRIITDYRSENAGDA